MGYHVAVIPDGNRRWARENDVDRKEGHRQGVERVKDLLKIANNYSFEELTFWAMSIDNYEKRDEEEVEDLIELLTSFVNSLKQEDSVVREQNANFRLAGDRDKIDDGLMDSIEELEDLTEGNEGLKLNLALAYDGKWDIVKSAEEVDEASRESIEENLELPEVDILVAYGEGRCYLSNFMCWQLGYATIHFADKNFPELSEEDFDEALEMHENRRNMRGC
jgi:undecaprenyl diphosphate synthase